MLGTRMCALLGVLLVLVPAASADVIVDLVDLRGYDSGWSAVLANSADNAIVVDWVADGTLVVEIMKTLRAPPSVGRSAANVIEFVQRLDDAATTATIVVTDEVIRNRTDEDWLDYHWEVEGPAVALNRTATEASSFSVAPFTQAAWGAPPSGWGADHAGSLDVSAGIVPPGGHFLPGLHTGGLIVNVDLGQDVSDFALVQYPTPEPAAVVLMAVGLLLLPRRRRR